MEMETDSKISTNKLLIDGDLLVWAETTAIEYTVLWDNDIHTLTCDFEEVKQRIDVRLVSLIERFDASSYTLAFSDSKSNFRNAINPDYKANRKLLRRPLSYRDAVAYCHDVWHGVTWANLEADDVLGILSTQYLDSIVVSKDKDTRTVPCTWFNPSHDDEGPQVISKTEADRFHLHQTLTGDRTDNYTGIPGCGPKTADKILDSESTWGSVVRAYEKAGLTEADALLNARWARICRHGDYTKTTGVVKPWNPQETP